MSLIRIFQQYDALGPLDVRALITLDQSFTGSAQLAAWFRKIFGVSALSLNLVTAQTKRTAERLELVGTASLLNLTDVPVTLGAVPNSRRTAGWRTRQPNLFVAGGCAQTPACPDTL